VVTSRGYGEKCDVYSFGIILYEVGLRRYPFLHDYGASYRRGGGHDLHRLIKAIVNDHLRPIVDDSAPPTCPSSLIWRNYLSLMRDCWAPLPGERSRFIFSFPNIWIHRQSSDVAADRNSPFGGVVYLSS
jgi:hypothetical protein